MDKRIDKKLEDWKEIQSIRESIRRRDSEVSENIKRVSHLASPEKSVYNHSFAGTNERNKTQDLNNLRELRDD